MVHFYVKKWVNTTLQVLLMCLFIAGSKIANVKDIEEMRFNVAATITSDPNTYCEAILEKSNEDYSNWIVKETSWGGAIEVSILSKWYSLEIVSLDVTNCIINRYYYILVY